MPRTELGVPAKLTGFVIALAAVFGVTFLTGSQFRDRYAMAPPTGPAPSAAGAPEPGHQSQQPGGQSGHDEQGAEHASTTPPATLDGYTLRLADDATGSGAQQIILTLLGPDGRPVTDYTVVQEKMLHLIVVREDLGRFAHVHPEQNASGGWTVEVDLAAGPWRVYADFQPTALGREITLSVPLALSGAYGSIELPAPKRTSTVDGYTVTASADPVEGEEAAIRIDISRGGRPVTDLQPYLGAAAHIVIIRYHDMAYLHVHGHSPSAGPTIDTATTFDSNGKYRMFVEFSHAGSVHRAEFTWDVT